MLLALPEQRAAGKPLPRVHDVEPRLVLVVEHPAHLTGLRVAEPDVVGVLQAVELLEDDLAGGVDPLHARHVGVARIAGQSQETDRAAGRIDDADPHGRVLRAGLRVGDPRDGGIERVGVVDQGEHLDPARIEMPEGDRLAVRAPAEPVAQIELLFVDPVRGPVDDRGRAVRGQRRDRPAPELLDVQVVRPNVGDPGPVGGELGEHQARFGSIAAELLELAARELQHPVVAAGVLAPDLLRVGEKEQARAVPGPGVVVDLERLAPGGRQARGRHENAAGAGRGVVAHDLLHVGEGGGRLDRRVGLAAFDPARGPEGPGLVLLLEEDARNLRLQFGGRLGVGREQAREREKKDRESDRGAAPARGHRVCEAPERYFRISPMRRK